ncbi:MAG: transposase [Akkermansia sp.]|nr:transposase [Akkermansia sp.]
MSEKSRIRTTYAPEEKAEIIMAVLTRKTTIQKVAKEKNVAPTLISLWKKQAEEAILERFVDSRPGRRKVEVSADDVKEELRAARIVARTAKTRATRLEAALKTAKARVAELEQGVRNMAATMGCKLAKAKRPLRQKD